MQLEKNMKVRFLILLAMSLFTISCGQVDCSKKPEAKECSDITDLDRIGFFKIVYQTIAVRGFSDQTWTSPIMGSRELKFDTTTTVVDESKLPDELEGSFIFNLDKYRRTSTQVACSGGYSGTFLLRLEESGVEADLPTNEKPPYNILDGNGNTSSPPTNPEDTDLSEIKTYTFDLGIESEAMVPEEQCGLIGSSSCDKFDEKCEVKKTLDSCKQIHYCKWKSAERSCVSTIELCQRIKIVRFENGQLIQDDYSKGSQFYYTPKLRTKK